MRGASTSRSRNRQRPRQRRRRLGGPVHQSVRRSIRESLSADAAAPSETSKPVETPKPIEKPKLVETPKPLDAIVLRERAWSVAERQPAHAFIPTASHVGLSMVSPCRGFAHWRLLDGWIRETAEQRGDAWYDCRMVLRIYDVSCLEFTGLNAHHVRDHEIGDLCGELFFDLPHGGTSQLAEVGFVLRDGEFLPAARSDVAQFAPGSPVGHGDQTALLVEDNGTIEVIDSLWDQERILIDRRTPKLRAGLRIGAFAFPGTDEFLSKLTAGLSQQGHEVHLFVPSGDGSHSDWPVENVQTHALEMTSDGSPLQQATRFARAVEKQLSKMQPFDLLHLHQWMAAMASWPKGTPTIWTLNSIETTRRNGSEPNRISDQIERAERDIASTVDCILVPDWLREQARNKLKAAGSRIHAFPMEGRLPNEWECQLDYGQVKGEISVGPLDRLLIFVGPLEHAAGVDLIVEALPTVLQQCPSVRVAFVGEGDQRSELEHRIGELGLWHAVRLLGHVESGQLVRLLRASEALLMPSRYRVPFDDAVVDMACRAGTAVITTHSGPAHLVHHEETGVITYDNTGSIVWAMNRVLEDPTHSQRMGEYGRRNDGYILNWNEVSRRYVELCATTFPHLTQTREFTSSQPNLLIRGTV